MRARESGKACHQRSPEAQSEAVARDGGTDRSILHPQAHFTGHTRLVMGQTTTAASKVIGPTAGLPGGLTVLVVVLGLGEL